MKKTLLVIIFTVISICSFAVSATWNAYFTKNVAWAKINGKIYTNIVVTIKSSRQGYIKTYTSGFLAGSSSITYPWVKIKIVDGENKKKILSKKLERSCLFVFDEGKHIQIGQPDDVSTEAIMDKKDGGWELVFDENGDL